MLEPEIGLLFSTSSELLDTIIREPPDTLLILFCVFVPVYDASSLYLFPNPNADTPILCKVSFDTASLEYDPEFEILFKDPERAVV